MQFIAIINIPGYLSMADEPDLFDTAAEAWDYLAAERRDSEDEYEEWRESYSETVLQLEANSMRLMADNTPYNFTGTVYGQTPGSDSEHDLGLAYSVDYYEGEFPECKHLHAKATCGICGKSWCDACDPTPSALCHYCHGRGYSTAPR